MNITAKKLKITCIFHKGCMDGWMSALPIWLAYNETAEMKFVPADYNDLPPVVDGDDYVFIVDFSYKPEVIINWYTGEAEVFLLDHHAKAIQALVDHPVISLKPYAQTSAKAIQALVDHPAISLKPYPESTIGGAYYSAHIPNLTAFLAFNEGKPFEAQLSGAGLVLTFLTAYQNSIKTCVPMTEIYSAVMKTAAISQSYDLWHHNGEELHNNTYLSLFFKAWVKEHREKFKRMATHAEESHALMMELANNWLSTSLEEKLKAGKAVTIEHGVKCRALCETAYEVKLPLLGYVDTKIGFIPGDNLDVSVSTLGSIAVREFGWDVIVMIAAVKDKNYIMSLRSNENAKNVDVAELCTQLAEGPYGLTGGGHRNAAGCTIRKADLEEVVSRIPAL